MTSIKFTTYTYANRRVVKAGRKYYTLMSKHLTKANAVKSPAYKDSFNFGKPSDKLVKYGSYWLVLQPLGSDVQAQIKKREER